ncbi:MAG: hypothetical protein J0I99_18625 [Devosia sp.]|mgnify:CR=1 FL=1|uniref:hypothetical protein n=1 Tax=Devosia sp. TaxID=1871048 RepID=UPI001AC30137|nr:hypothetical protein [Devosia sp.]MBN9317760.1 hypothetical protein [Devosia sp.]
MDFKSELAGRYLRIIAIIALLLGLADASRLLGVSTGAQSPLTQLGPIGFSYLAVFCIARLFAAVGLWIRANWGAVLLAGATLIELALYLAGVREVQMEAVGFAIRLLLVGSLGVLFFLNFRMRRSAQD